MARKSVNVKLGQSLGNGRWSSSVKSSDVPSFPSTATVAADVATLVSDGATPTQGHVTTLNTDWGVLNTAAANVSSAVTGDVSLVWDASVVTSLNALRHAVAVAIRLAEGGYGGLSE
jgi:hypothetical protein